MKNIFIFILISLIFSACNLKKVEKSHGVKHLDKKQEKLIINKTNKNDIIKILGSPSTKSTFDNDIWIYIEKKTNHSSIVKFGKEIILTNNVLILEINSMGLLEKKEFLELNNMKDIEFTEKTTTSDYKKTSFLFDFLSSLRQKISDPLNKRKK